MVESVQSIIADAIFLEKERIQQVMLQKMSELPVACSSAVFKVISGELNCNNFLQVWKRDLLS